jgi:hypothetical protein
MKVMKAKLFGILIFSIIIATNISTANNEIIHDFPVLNNNNTHRSESTNFFFEMEFEMEFQKRENLAKKLTSYSQNKIFCKQYAYEGLWIWENKNLKCPKCNVFLLEFIEGTLIENGKRI